MSNSNYQAVYDAVRNSGIDDVINSVGQSLRRAVILYESPSVIHRPKLSIDGNQWCALYGDDLQSGVAGFGDSPSAAMSDFDRRWVAKLPQVTNYE